MTITASTGIGKTTFVREIAYHLHTQGERQVDHVGRVNKQVSSVHRFTPRQERHGGWSVATDDEIEEARSAIQRWRNIYLYDRFGSSDIDIIIQRITYMVKALGVRWVILDHVSICLRSSDQRRPN